MKIGLVGNPNTGKTTLFNALTGAKERVGNWQGVTVGAKEGSFTENGVKVQVVDLPGLYSLSSFSFEEKEAIKGLKECDFVVNVIECANLKRSLLLTSQLIESGIKLIVLLNMKKELVKAGGSIDEKVLSKLLGVSVFDVEANKRRKTEFFKKILANINPDNIKTVKNSVLGAEEIADACFTPPRTKESLADKICMGKFTAIPVFISIMAAVFYLTFGKYGLGTFLSEKMDSGAQKLAALSEAKMTDCNMPDFLISFVVKGVLGGVGAIAAFLPQVAVLCLSASVLECSGYICRLAFFADGLFEKIGLNGRAVFSVVMGLGCTAAAVMSARGLDNQSIRKKTVFVLPCVSCGGRMPLYLLIASSLAFKGQTLIIGGIYLLSLAAAFFTAYILKREDNSQAFIMEMPPWRFPGFIQLIKLLKNYLGQFIIKICTTVLAAMAAMWLLSSFTPSFKYIESGEGSFLYYIVMGLKYLFYPMGIKDWQVAVAAIMGLIAKEAAAGALATFYPQGFAAAVGTVPALCFLLFSALYTPCLAALMAIEKETGKKIAAISALYQFILALLAAYLMRAVLVVQLKFGFIASFALAAFVFGLAAASVYLRKKYCAACGKRCSYAGNNCKRFKKTEQNNR